MSYIRCLSNPEGLYIWGDMDGHVWICQNADDAKRIPQEIWNGLFEKYDREGCDEQDDLGEYCDYKGFRVYDFVNIAPPVEKTGDPVKDFINSRGEWRVRMQYADWKIDMWAVTFSQIERHANWRPPNPAPWEVLTGVYFYRELKDWLDMKWFYYFTKDGRECRRKNKKQALSETQSEPSS